MIGLRPCKYCPNKILGNHGASCSVCESEQARVINVRYESLAPLVHRQCSPSPPRLRIRRYEGADLAVTTTATADHYSGQRRQSAVRYTASGSSDRDVEVERARLREARDRGVNEDGTRWSRRTRDFERERLDSWGGREYDREYDYEIRRERPRRRGYYCW